MPTSPGTTGLVAWWALDEASGDRADSHSGGYTLTDNNTVGAGTAHVGANAASFAAASSEYLSTANGSVLAAVAGSSWTITGWANPVTVTGGAPLGTWDGGFAGLALRLNTGGTANSIVAQWINDAGGSVLAEAAVAQAAGTWAFFAVTYDAVANRLYMRTNGTTSAGTVTSGTYSAQAEFRLGDWGEPGPHSYYNGRLDEVAVWSRALSTDELDWLYNAGAGRAYSALAGAAKGLPIIAHHYRAVFGGGR